MKLGGGAFWQILPSLHSEALQHLLVAYTYHALLHKILRILVEVNAESFDDTFPSGINVFLKDKNKAHSSILTEMSTWTQI